MVFLLTAGRRAAMATSPAPGYARPGEAGEAMPGMLDSIRSGLRYVFGWARVWTGFVVSIT